MQLIRDNVCPCLETCRFLQAPAIKVNTITAAATAPYVVDINMDRVFIYLARAVDSVWLNIIKVHRN